MKKILLGSLFALTSVSSVAGPYVGLEYGVLQSSHNYETSFEKDIRVAPEKSSSIYGGFIGYKFDQFGVELGYRQFSLDGSRELEKWGSVPNQPHPVPYSVETNWDTKLDVKQIKLQPVYFHTLTTKLNLKLGLGVTYTQYDYSASTYKEYDFEPYDYETREPLPGGEQRDTAAFGASASIGLQYQLPYRFSLGVGVDAYADHIMNAVNVNINTVYEF
ncbi:AcfA family outer membrane beta-barrel protein [Photobacterium damselae]|uniref:AcfA family outer membrane beta-barrel protein n=1 Tax=Photobacterium damselae TaxID=38293 RepID=UPI004068C35A